MLEGPSFFAPWSPRRQQPFSCHAWGCKCGHHSYPQLVKYATIVACLVKISNGYPMLSFRWLLCHLDSRQFNAASLFGDRVQYTLSALHHAGETKRGPRNATRLRKRCTVVSRQGLFGDQRADPGTYLGPQHPTHQGRTIWSR